MAKLTIPTQVFTSRSFKGRDGTDVPITVFSFIRDGILTGQAEAIGKHEPLLKRLMESGEPLDVPDDAITVGQYGTKVKIPKSDGGGASGGGGWKGGGGFTGGKPRYQGRKLRIAEWLAVTETVYGATFDMIKAALGTKQPDGSLLASAVEQARAMTSQFWIEVESGVIDLDAAAPDSTTQPVTTTQHAQPPAQEEPADYYLTMLNGCKSQADVLACEQEIARSVGHLSDGQREAIRMLAMARKRELAKQGK